MTKPLVVALITLMASPAAFAVQQSTPQPPPRVCLDEQGDAYSRGALRRVAGQVQECSADLQWVAGTTDASKPPVHQQGPSCVANGGQRYEAAMLRMNGKSVERCDNGAWKTVGSAF